VKLKIVDMPYNELITALINKKVDIVVAAMPITPEKEKIINFSIPYYTAGEAIVVKGNKSIFKNINDLVNHTVAVQKWSVGDAMVSKIKGINVKRFEKFTDALLELVDDKVDAVVLNYSLSDAYTSVYKELKISAGPFHKEDYGIAVGKSDKELLDFINNTISTPVAKSEIELNYQLELLSFTSDLQSAKIQHFLYGLWH
jgi:ABC-type amino acid transport substrate-binding protein